MVFGSISSERTKKRGFVVGQNFSFSQPEKCLFYMKSPKNETQFINPLLHEFFFRRFLGYSLI